MDKAQVGCVAPCPPSWAGRGFFHIHGAPGTPRPTGWFIPPGFPSLAGVGKGGAAGCRLGGNSHLLRQRLADFETFGELAEAGGVFPGQHAGQPMPHACQQMFAALLALEFPLPEWMRGEDRLGTAGKLRRIILGNVRAEIIPRLVQHPPRNVSRAQARVPFKVADGNELFNAFNLY